MACNAVVVRWWDVLWKRITFGTSPLSYSDLQLGVIRPLARKSKPVEARGDRLQLSPTDRTAVS